MSTFPVDLKVMFQQILTKNCERNKNVLIPSSEKFVVFNVG